MRKYYIEVESLDEDVDEVSQEVQHALDAVDSTIVILGIKTCPCETGVTVVDAHYPSIRLK